MPTTKLTLTIAPKTIAKAKRYARSHKTSVSALFSRMIDSLAKDEDAETQTVPKGSVLHDIAGIIKSNGSQNIDDMRYEALSEKYGLEKND